MKRVVSFAVGALVLLGAASSACAAGNVTAPRGGDQPVEVIVVTAKRVRPEPIDVVVVTVKRPSLTVGVGTPPAMPIEIPRLEFAVAEPVVKL